MLLFSLYKSVIITIIIIIIYITLKFVIECYITFR